MGERKVLNKYYSPDFDPAKISRGKQPKNQQTKVRMMLPMSIRCNTCGNYISKGTKFNSRKEDVAGETYLRIQIFRFYFKCSKCSAELTMKTDPQYSDYIMEAGASRNYEPWRATDEVTNEAVKKREREEVGDSMKALENRTLDSKQQMDIMAALDELKSMRSRHATIAVEDMMAAFCHKASERDKEMEALDEAILKSIVFQKSRKPVQLINNSELEEDGEEIIDEESPGPHRSESGYSAKRRKLLEVEKEAPGQAAGTLGKQVPEAKGAMKPPSFAVRMNPVAFNIKPKVMAVVPMSSTKEVKQEAVAEHPVKRESQEPTVDVTSLGLTYGISDDDSQ